MELVEFFQSIKTPMTVVHVISVVFGMGAAFMTDVLFTFYGKDKKLSLTEIKTLRVLSHIVWWGLIIIALSGLGIFLSDITKYTHSVKFIAKMSILGILILNGHILHTYIWHHVLKQQFLGPARSPIRKIAFVCGAVSMISWVSVCTLGVLDTVSFSYNTIMIWYGVLLLFGSIIALFIEQSVFEKK